MAAHQLDTTTNAVIADIALILVVGAALAIAARRLRQPPVVAEILAGIVLGPTLLGQLPGHLSARLFPVTARPFLSVVSQLGILLFMFLVGWEFNRAFLRGRQRTAVLSVSLSAMVLPFACGAALALAFYGRHDHVAGQHVNHTAFVLYLGAALSITAFPVLARFLADSGRGGTRVGELALVSAAVCDALAWCMLAVVVAVIQATGPGGLVRIAAELVAYALLLGLVVRPLLDRLVRRWGREGGSPYLVPVVAAGVFLSAAATSWIGIHAIFGAFAFGCVMPRRPRGALLRYVREPLQQAGVLLLPVFFIVVGLSVDLTALTAADLAEGAAVIVVASAAKIAGAGLPVRIMGDSWREAGVLGVLMNMRGLTELIVLNLGVAMGVLDTRMYSLMVVMALVTTVSAGLLIRPLPAEPDWAWNRPEEERVLAEPH